MKKPECFYRDPRCVTSDDCHCYGAPEPKRVYVPPISALEQMLIRVRNGNVLTGAELTRFRQLEAEDDRNRAVGDEYTFDPLDTGEDDNQAL